MDRTERLLDLVALLLDAQEPITWAELREHFPDDYGKGSQDAAERKFERDKAELIELGIPITYVTGDDELRDGYLVDKEAYYLPETGLAKDELAVLYAAGSAALASGAFPGRAELAHALRKIGFFAKGAPAVPPIRMELGAVRVTEGLSAALEDLWDASARKKFVMLTYFSPHKNQTTSRRVDPYGLALRRGVWSLVGYCHLREGVRTFHVHRIRELTVNQKVPRSSDFEVPKDFSLDQYVASYPWQHRLQEPVDVELLLRGELSDLAGNLFPGATVSAVPDSTDKRVTVRASYLDGLLQYALGLGSRCRVVGPPDAQNRFRQMANRILEQHREEVAS